MLADLAILEEKCYIPRAHGGHGVVVAQEVVVLLVRVRSSLVTPSRIDLRKSGGFLVYRGIFEEF